jgi:hypothetical protein
MRGGWIFESLRRRRTAGPVLTIGFGLTQTHGSVIEEFAT